MKGIHTYIIEKLHLNKDIKLAEPDLKKFGLDILYNFGWQKSEVNNDGKEWGFYTPIKEFLKETMPHEIKGFIKDNDDFKKLCRKPMVESEDRWVNLNKFYTISDTVDGINFDKFKNKIIKEGKVLWTGAREKLIMYDVYLLLTENTYSNYPPIIIKAEQ